MGQLWLSASKEREVIGLGLTGARVLLLDDDPGDALPVIRAFSKAGIPLAYYDGKPSGFPRKADRLRGVRLAILDMDLGEGTSDASKASALVQKFSRVLDPGNGPYGILIWTNNPDLRELTARYIFAKEDLPNPVFIVELTKAECKNAQSVFSMNLLLARLREKLGGSSPLDCLQVWEDCCFTAATNVTNTIAEFADSGLPDLARWGSAWQRQLLSVLHASGDAMAERHLTEENCIASAFLSMNPLHSDRMDLLVERIARTVRAHSSAVYGATASSVRSAEINSMLHLAFHELGSLPPGNMYVFGVHKPTWMPPLKSVLENCIVGNGPQQAANLTVLFGAARLLGIEISPVCDHAQKKLRQSRILAGFLVPKAQVSLIKGNAGFLKVLGPFHLSGAGRVLEGNYTIFLNSQYTPTAEPSVVGKLRAFARFRSQLLSDAQAWCSYQNARQGVMMLR
jgi:hypothetical protein